MTKEEWKEIKMAWADLGIDGKAHFARLLEMGKDNAYKYLKPEAKHSYWVKAFMLGYRLTKEVHSKKDNHGT